MSSSEESSETPLHIKRLIDWNSEVLLRLLKQVEAKRIASGKSTWNDEPVLKKEEGKLVFDEVTDVIDLPAFYVRTTHDPDYVTLPSEAESQLRAYVSAVANAYHSNPFHCLQHASQVTMALTKLLSRIVVRQLGEIDEEGEEYSDSDSDSDEGSSSNSQNEVKVQVTESVAAHLHNHTFGITSDPLTQFGLVLAAFIHAVDHTGLPNPALAKEDPDAAKLYQNRSIIEQRSVDKAWKKLMEPSFRELRRCIYTDGTELLRFRQVVVNSVLATDIKDEELQNMRMKRWEKTFSRGRAAPTVDDINRKATIVIEHLMQASHIFHTMQPWIVYEKWSSRLFEELYLAFKSGRSKDDPSQSWYQQELDFLDNYAIPLAMQLKDCDAFVVSSDEYLIYAIKNRQQLAAKGKGMIAAMVTKINSGQQSQSIPASRLSTTPVSSSSSRAEDDPDRVSKHIQRLVNWNVEMLQRLLKQVVAKRNALGITGRTEAPKFQMEGGSFRFDEFTEAIEFPDFDPSTSPDKLDPDSVALSDAVMSQLRDFVTYISSKFRDNPFHCFDHGSHVCMTTRKLLSRIVTHATLEMSERLSLQMHTRTFGISSDPLAQFAVVFAALINDIDHSGVPNSHLVKEGSDLAKQYKNRCISEQHSIEVAWNHLMDPKFEDLRTCIYSDQKDARRFQQIVVNCVLCTDLVDEEVVAFRKERWQRAFVDGAKDTSRENLNRKATIVLETMMQCSDMFHATQNWHVYNKWNERHFEEMYYAYQQGQLSQDPCIFWYKSELIFFDEQVIPMAKKMSDTGVFDCTGDEYLSFALSNRQQWAAKGGDIIASMVAKFHWKEIEKIRTKQKHKRRSLSAMQA